jgi:hypothetical protein
MIELFELQSIDTGFVLGLLLTATTLIINELI